MEQKTHLKIQVSNLHCYSCSRTFDNFTTFGLHHHHIDNTSKQNQSKIQDEPRTAACSNNDDFTPSQQEEQIEDFEKQQPNLKKIREIKDKDASPSTDIPLSIDKPSTKTRKKDQKLVNFYHCPNCYEVFNRLPKLKDHFSNCTHTPTERFDEFHLNRKQNNINNNDPSSGSTLNEESSSQSNKNNTPIGNESSNPELHFDLDVRCTKCQLDFIFFDDLIDHLKTLHLISSKESIQSPSLSPVPSLQPTELEKKKKSKTRRKKNESIHKKGNKVNHEDSTAVKHEYNEQNIVDSLSHDDNTEFDNDDVDHHFSADDFDDPRDENYELNKISKNDPSQEDKTDTEGEKSLFLSSLSLAAKKQNKRKRPKASSDDTTQIKKKRVRKQRPKRIISCDVSSCEEKFSSKRSLSEHKKTIHHIIVDSIQNLTYVKPMTTTGKDMIEKNFMCELCGCAFRTTNGLAQHLFTHTGVKNWVCSYEGCGRSFNRKTLLKRHELCHTKELPHLCFTCGLVFRDNTSLQSHVNTHTGEKPYKCSGFPDCDKAYAGARALRAHMETHRNERKFQCQQCPAAFNFPDVLKRHLKVHERPKEIKSSS